MRVGIDINPLEPRSRHRPPVSFMSLHSPESPLLLRKRLLHRKIEFENVDARLAENSKAARRRLLLNESRHLVWRRAARPGHTLNLQGCVRRRDVRVKAGSRTRQHIGRHGLAGEVGMRPVARMPLSAIGMSIALASSCIHEAWRIARRRAHWRSGRTVQFDGVRSETDHAFAVGALESGVADCGVFAGE